MAEDVSSTATTTGNELGKIYIHCRHGMLQDTRLI